MRVERLFASPFGKDAFDRWAAAPRLEDAPYGVSRGDDERLGNILAAAARKDRGRRQMGGYTLMGMGALTGFLGIALVLEEPSFDNDTANDTIGGVLGMGVFALVVDGDLEDMHTDYALAPRESEGERATTVAAFEKRLAESAADYRRSRHVAAWLSVAMTAGRGLSPRSTSPARAASNSATLGFSALAR